MGEKTRMRREKHSNGGWDKRKRHRIHPMNEIGFLILWILRFPDGTLVSLLTTYYLTNLPSVS